MTRLAAILPLILALALLAVPGVSRGGEKSADGEPSSLFGGPFRVQLQGGYTGTVWQPRGLGPYEVNSYGRSLVYAELALHHPLLVINEALDFISVPKLRVETNFGYSTTSGGFTDLIPEPIRDNPYLRTTSWMTFFRYFSLRYRSERFEATLQDPRVWSNQADVTATFSTLQMTNHMHDLEVGVIGSPDGLVHDTMIEIGYYRSVFQWPMVHVVDQRNADGPVNYMLIQQDFTVDGIYASLNTTPIKGEWPLHSQLMVRVGGAYGLDARFRFERPLLKHWLVGIEADASWWLINSYKSDSQGIVEVENDNPRDTRYRLTLYSLVTLW